MKTTHGNARVEFQVRFSRGPKGKRRVQEAKQKSSNESRPQPVPPEVPKITRLLVLGYHFERLVRDGKVKNYAAIARLTGLSRARVTHITDLCLLPPNIQERILFQASSLLEPQLRAFWKKAVTDNR